MSSGAKESMRGCLKLIDQVFDLFKDKCRFVDEEEGIELSLQELLKAESICSSKGNFGRTYDDSVNEERIGEARLTAAEYAWWSMGDYECRDYLLHGGGYSKPFLSNQSGTFGSSIGSEVDDEESPPPRPVLLGVLACHRRLLSDRMRSRFQEDLDYNFVADCEVLRFHHACENLIFDGDCIRYVEAVIGGCVEKGPHVLRHLFQLRNAQGQTPLHLALESHSSHYLVRLIPGGKSGQENAECLNMRDSRGWTALHCASVRSSTCLYALLEDGRADVNATVERISGERWDCTRATPLHLAVIHNRSVAVQWLLQDPRTDVNALFRRQIYFDDSLYVSRLGYDVDEWTTLQLAAMAGLPGMVKVLMTCPRVCICLHINHNQGYVQFSHTL